MKREYLAEFLGTAVLLFFTNGIVASGIFFHAWNSFFELSLITGLGVTLGIYVASPHSQAHLNPAITLAMTLCRGFPKGKVLPYLLANFQVLSAEAYSPMPCTTLTSLVTTNQFLSFFTPHQHRK